MEDGIYYVKQIIFHRQNVFNTSDQLSKSFCTTDHGLDFFFYMNLIKPDIAYLQIFLPEKNLKPPLEENNVKKTSKLILVGCC